MCETIMINPIYIDKIERMIWLCEVFALIGCNTRYKAVSEISVDSSKSKNN